MKTVAQLATLTVAFAFIVYIRVIEHIGGDVAVTPQWIVWLTAAHAISAGIGYVACMSVVSNRREKHCQQLQQQQQQQQQQQNKGEQNDGQHTAAG